MHETTQRRVCRMAFVLACAVPTLCTIAWVLYFHRPWQERDWRHAIENALHVRVKLNQVSAPRPLERELFNLRLVDLNSSQTLLDVGRLHIQSQRAFVGEQIEIHRQQLKSFAKTVSIWLASDNFQDFSIVAKGLAITDVASDSSTLKNLKVIGHTTSTNIRQIAIQAECGDDAQPLRLLIERRADGTVHTTLDAQQTKLPAWLLADLVPGAGGWHDARFTGTVRWDCISQSVRGTLRGKISSIDTQQWIGIGSPQRLQTQANLQLDSMTWREERLESAQGALTTSSGIASPSLVKALQEALLCVLNDASVISAAVPTEFDQIACRFRLNSAGLTLSGVCPLEGAAGCLVVAAGKPLVMQPTVSDIPLGNFVRVFCPLEQPWLWLPATREATSMAEKLPLPEAESKKQ